MDEQDERLRRFNEKLRYSQDRCQERVRRVRERRTYSDDYEEKARRESFMVRPPTPKHIDRENKRNAYARLSRDSRVNYTEVEFSKRDQQRPSNVGGSASLAKHCSMECSRSMRQVVREVVPRRRAFSQSDDHRPSSPVPPIEWNDEDYVPKKLPSEHQKRDQKSTRYKVYLT